MHPNRSYFFVHYGGAIQIIEPEPNQEYVKVPRPIPGGDCEILGFARIPMAGQNGARYYFYADTRLSVDQAIDILLSPPHREPHREPYREPIPDIPNSDMGMGGTS